MLDLSHSALQQTLHDLQLQDTCCFSQSHACKWLLLTSVTGAYCSLPNCFPIFLHSKDQSVFPVQDLPIAVTYWDQSSDSINSL